MGRLLLERGADVTARDWVSCWRGLMYEWAVLVGYGWGGLGHALSAAIRRCAFSQSGASLIMHAADFSEDIALFMLKAGANPSVIDLVSAWGRAWVGGCRG